MQSESRQRAWSWNSISPSDFINGGEVDFTAHYWNKEKQKHGRISMRQLHGRFYQVYVHYHNILSDPEEEVLKTGTLDECVKLTNELFGLEDQVVSE